MELETSLIIRAGTWECDCGRQGRSRGGDLPDEALGHLKTKPRHRLLYSDQTTLMVALKPRVRH